MSSKLEKLTNMLLMVIETNNMVTFGSNEHIEIVKIINNIQSIEEIKNIDNEYIKRALKFITEDKRLSNILKENNISMKLYFNNNHY